jgi:hypothetical protein
MSALDTLISSPSPDRAALLAGFQARAEAAYALLTAVRASHRTVAEQASRLDLNRLRHRLAPPLVPVAGRLREYAVQLRSVLEHCDIPVDIVAAYRRVRAARDDSSFNGSAASLTRDTARFTSHAEHAAILAQRVDTELAVLENAADRLFSAEFVVTEPHARAWTATH